MTISDIALNTALAVPGVRALQKLRAKSTGANATDDSCSVMIEWSDKVQENVVRYGRQIAGRKLVELGPGHSLGVAMCHLFEGARSVDAVDVVAFADPTDESQFDKLAEAWSKAKAKPVPSVSTALERFRYHVCGDDVRWPIEDGSTDILYSYFAGEHMRDPERVLDQVSRVLRADGIGLFAIDLRNHLDHAGNWLAHLYHTDKTWKMMTSRRGAWTNRITADQWRELFSSRFSILEFYERQSSPPDGFKPASLAPQFRELPLQRLLIDYIWVVCEPKSDRVNS